MFLAYNCLEFNKEENLQLILEIKLFFFYNFTYLIFNMIFDKNNGFH